MPLARLALAVTVLAPLSALPAQSIRPLTHRDYDGWKSIAGLAIRSDGDLVAYTLQPQEGDGELIVRRATGEVIYRRARGARPAFTAGGRWLVFTIEPAWKEQREHRARRGGGGSSSAGTTRRGSRGERGGAPGASRDGPARALAIVEIAALAESKGEDVETKIIDKVKSFRVPEEGPSVVVYHLEAPARSPRGRGGAAKPSGAKERRASEKKPSEKKPSGKEQGGAAGKDQRRRGGRGRPGSQAPSSTRASKLVLRDLATGKTKEWRAVTSFGLLKKQQKLWLVQDEHEHGQGDRKRKVRGGLRVGALAPAAGHPLLLSGPGKFSGLTVDEEERRLAFFFSPKAAKKPEKKKTDETKPEREAAAGEAPADRSEEDDDSETFVYTWDFATKAPDLGVAAGKTPGFPKGRRVSTNPALSFSRDGSVLMFGAAPPKEPKGPEVHPDDKVDLDLWHWKDPLLQPMQARRASQERRRAAVCVLHLDSGEVTPIASQAFDSVRLITDDGNLALAQTSRPYAQLVSWDGRYTDYWRVRTSDGAKKKVLARQRGQAGASPSGRWLVYFGADAHWHSLDLQSLERYELTGGLGVAFDREDHDTPSPARAYGVAGWTDGDRDVLIYDCYDIWRIAPDGSSRVCITDGWGRANKTELRYVQLDPEARTIDPGEPMLLSATDTETMASGYYRDTLDGVGRPKKLVMLDMAFGRTLRKAKDADRVFFTLSTFREFPNYWTSDLTFAERTKLTDANPQQRGIRWGDAELVRWTSADGMPLKGILVKPEGFDPSKKYPMIVYFYEKLSRRLHSYTTPAPRHSPNASYYVSNGYLFFMPDIVYREGYPGESCLKSVVPGVLSLIRRGYVKRGAIGAAGHSWGGYQTAYLITRTNLFKAVESGAPVSNMTSAYGGIRWSSGMSRMFQYEQTQSRIGGSLWEYPMRYLENSPVFAADKVRTPILMLHNDQDGAVPWYQGIEFFVALRRLGKEAYLFNYVGEGHGIRKRAAQKDFSRRMQEFFDHHLKGAPAPEWMVEGVPYVSKVKEKWKYLEKPAETEVATPERGGAKVGEAVETAGAKGGGNGK